MKILKLLYKLIKKYDDKYNKKYLSFFARVSRD